MKKVEIEITFGSQKGKKTVVDKAMADFLIKAERAKLPTKEKASK